MENNNYLFWITFFLFIITGLYIYDMFYKEKNKKEKKDKKIIKEKNISKELNNKQKNKQNDNNDIFSIDDLNNNSLNELDSMVKNII
jgi:uncharacterized membrane protein